MKKDIYKSTFGLGDICQRTQGTTTQPSSHTTGIMKGITTIQKRKYTPRIKCYITKDRQLMSKFIWAHIAEGWVQNGRAEARSQQKAESSHLKPQAHAQHELKWLQVWTISPPLLTQPPPARPHLLAYTSSTTGDQVFKHLSLWGHSLSNYYVKFIIQATILIHFP